MAPGQPIAPANARDVTVIGANSQIVPAVGFFVGGGIHVLVITHDAAVEDRLAPYPGVQVVRCDPDYGRSPVALPETPFFVGVDQPETAQRIRSWLPATLAVFLLSSTHRRRHQPGFLSFLPTPDENRRRLLRRLAILRRVDALLALARGARSPLILMYQDPDPDAIGAALGLATLWRSVGAKPRIRYTGEIQRYQNKLLLSYLKEDIERLKDDELAESDLVAVVDAQPGFWKDSPPPARVVIDHHPLREDTTGEFVDLRPAYGSTSTIVAEYLLEADLPLSRQLATALLYGLTSDTDDLQRNASSADIKIYDALHGRAEAHFLARLAKSQVPMPMLDWIAWGLSHRVVVRDFIIIHFGSVPTPDALVQCADLALLTCGINWVVCAGVHDDRLIVVFRGDGHRQDVGKRATMAFAKLGSAGGHRTMGRAEIPLKGEHVDSTVDLLVDNLFKRMGAARRTRLIRTLRNHLHGAGPADPERAVLPGT